jgi:hypothetical protein
LKVNHLFLLIFRNKRVLIFRNFKLKKGVCKRYGNVESVLIHENDKIVKIFVKYKLNKEAENAIQQLNATDFGGRIIKVEIYDKDDFINKNYKN